MDFNLDAKSWWESVPEGVKELLKDSVALHQKSFELGDIHDYSFIVFPAAKAYEGILKKVFFDLGFITKENYLGKHFRIGKALNPSLDQKYRHESVYDRIIGFCGGRDLADYLWNTWKNCRNILFHWFPGEKNVITLKEAEERVEEIVSAVDRLYKECRIKL